MLLSMPSLTLFKLMKEKVKLLILKKCFLVGNPSLFVAFLSFYISMYIVPRIFMFHFVPKINKKSEVPMNV